MTINKFQHLGTSQDVTTCDCCGRSNLKSTVVIRDVETDDELYFGVSCAAKALTIGVKEVKNAAAAADRIKEEAKKKEEEAKHKAQTERWHAHLIAKLGRKICDWSGQLDVYKTIQALGGMKTASEGFAG